MKLSDIRITVADVNAVLPQTQCGLCDYDGCKPYAEAIVSGEAEIDHCPPGGVRGLSQLANVVGVSPKPFVDEVAKIEKPRMLAVIREDECIGCTKCIQACPVDAILGAGKLMHSVINHECSGCELCVEPCPVDCIDMIELGSINDLSERELSSRSNQYRERYEFREQRLEKDKEELRKKHRRSKVIMASQQETDIAKKQFIQEALARAQAKREAK